MTIAQPGDPIRPEPSSTVRQGSALWTNLVNVALFYGGWFACAFGLALKWPLLGPLCALAVVGIHLALRPDWRSELLAIGCVVLLGPVIETTLGLLQVCTFPEPLLLGVLAPPTMFALWAVFATTFDGALGWLTPRPLLAAGFAAVGAPLSYVAGERLGALQLSAELWAWLVPVVVLWAIGFPLLLRLSAWVRRLTAPPVAPHP